MSDDRFSRRGFFREVGTYGLAGFAAVAGLSVLSACNKEEKPAASVPGAARNAVDAAKEAADPCTDVSKLTKDELATRETFKYEEVASDPQKLCKTCNFWQPAPDGELCGGCTLVKGPIHPLGSCMSWVEKIKT